MGIQDTCHGGPRERPRRLRKKKSTTLKSLYWKFALSNCCNSSYRKGAAKPRALAARPIACKMLFTEAKVKGGYLIELEKKFDERGFFARAFCQKEFQAHNIVAQFVQCNVSFNKSKGTLRGMHRQVVPHEEDKLIRCTRGAVFGMMLDLRRNSPTFRKWQGFELTQDNHRSIFIPGGCAAGYQTLQDNSEVVYLVSEFYTPGAEEGFRYNDLAFGIELPTEVTVISEKDKNWPDYAL